MLSTFVFVNSFATLNSSSCDPKPFSCAMSLTTLERIHRCNWHYVQPPTTRVVQPVLSHPERREHALASNAKRSAIQEDIENFWKLQCETAIQLAEKHDKKVPWMMARLTRHEKTKYGQPDHEISSWNAFVHIRSTKINPGTWLNQLSVSSIEPESSIRLTTQRKEVPRGAAGPCESNWIQGPFKQRSCSYGWCPQRTTCGEERGSEEPHARCYAGCPAHDGTDGTWGKWFNVLRNEECAYYGLIAHCPSCSVPDFISGGHRAIDDRSGFRFFILCRQSLSVLSGGGLWHHVVRLRPLLSRFCRCWH